MSTIDPQAVLEALNDSAGRRGKNKPRRGVHLAELSSRLGVGRERRGAVLTALDQLVEEERVRELPGRRFRLTSGAPASTESVVEGYLFVHPRGFGFVTAEDGGPDVFIPPDALGPALHGDRVEVSARPSTRGREGSVRGVLARRPAELTGRLARDGRRRVFLPDDTRLRGPMEIEGKVPREATESSVLTAEIVGFPQSDADACVVRVLSVLGAEGTAQVEAARILVREGVEVEFDAACAAEAAALPDRVLPAERKGREDLRGMDLVTIDPPDAKDHDDALFAERLPKGGFRVVIAIADVSHYVRPGTAIDAAAMARGVSIYLPTRSIPMLPRPISSGIASLVPKKDRLCLAVEVELSSRGRVRSHRFIEGVMRSGARLTYATVARALGLTEQGKRSREAEQRLPMLETLLDLSRLLRKRRLERGALDFDLPEPKIVFEHGEPVDVERSRTDPGVREAYRLVEEMMLLANEVVATALTERKVPAIYRIHGKPDEEKLELFAQLANSLGFDLDVERAKDPKQLGRFLERIDGLPEAPVLRYLLLRAMQQAQYDVSPGVGHFGLASPDYLHFTSPIRRYPDLTVHRVVRMVARGERIDGVALRPQLRKAAAEASRLERRAMGVERDVVSVYRALPMRDRVGEIFDATITGTTDSGFYAALDAPFVETFTPLARLDVDYFELDRLGIRLTGFRTGRVYTQGDRVRLRVAEVSVSRREIVAIPEDLPPPREGGEGQRRSKRGAPKGRGERPRSSSKGPRSDKSKGSTKRRAGGDRRRKRRR